MHGELLLSFSWIFDGGARNRRTMPLVQFTEGATAYLREKIAAGAWLESKDKLSVTQPKNE
jgi:hypothetical protein